MFGCQQVLISDAAVFPYLEFVCSEANKLINCGIYYGRQIYFKTRRIISKFDLNYEYKRNLHFQFLCAQAAQQTLQSVAESFSSFRKLLGCFKRGEIKVRPKPPNYRKKGGLALITYPRQALKLVDNAVRFPLGDKVKASFGIRSFSLPMPSNLSFEQIREVRILPRNGCFYAEFVYRLETVQANVDPSRALGIDTGINNWLTCVSNVETSFIVDGRHLKSVNRWYNKQVATLKENRPQGFWSKRLACLTEKRNRQMRDAINKAARLILNHCLAHRIGTIVFGWNAGIKTEVNLGKKTNQSFVQIPTARLKTRLAQLCEQYGLRFIEHEEANTSAASFVDRDSLPAFGEKPEGWQSSGKRTKRGLFRTASNWYINADANAAANIIRKVAATAGLDLAGVSRGSLTAPTRIRFWVTAKKTRSSVALAHCVASA